MFALSRDADAVEKIPNTHLRIRYYHSDELLFLAPKTKTIFLDTSHQKMATLSASKEASLLEGCIIGREKALAASTGASWG